MNTSKGSLEGVNPGGVCTSTLHIHINIKWVVASTSITIRPPESKGKPLLRGEMHIISVQNYLIVLENLIFNEKSTAYSCNNEVKEDETQTSIV